MAEMVTALAAYAPRHPTFIRVIARFRTSISSNRTEGPRVRRGEPKGPSIAHG
jgi:hypothetical protein